MAGQVKGPYSMADVERWNNDLQTLERTRQEIELALQAGFPCQEQDAACKALRDQLMQLKRVYAPGVP